MTRLKFFKLTGAGNDFALIFRPPKALRGPRLARRLCDRRRGIGADGLLLLDGAPSKPRLSYFNADGSKAFCGNGTRCAAWWLHHHGQIRAQTLSLKTAVGLVRAKITGSQSAAIALPTPNSAKLGIKLRALGRSYVAHWIDAGVPHAVIEAKNPRSVPLERLGPLLRRHKIFGRQGANIDIANFSGNHIVLRTFERGVEAETLACGTGAVAAACVGRALGRLRGDMVRVLTRGSEELKVLFSKREKIWGQEDLWLEGPVMEVFSGEITL